MKRLVLLVIALLLVGCGSKPDNEVVTGTETPPETSTEVSGEETTQDGEEVAQTTPDENQTEVEVNDEDEKPSETKPSTSTGGNTTTTKPAETKPSTSPGGTTTKPAETKPSTSTGGNTTTTKPAETKPSTSTGGSTTTSKPAETKPSTSTGGNTTTTKPAETKPTQPSAPTENTGPITTTSERKRVTTQKMTEVTVDDPTMEVGSIKVQPGRDGSKLVEYTYHWQNGKIIKTDERVISEVSMSPKTTYVGTKVVQLEPGRFVDAKGLLGTVNSLRKENNLNELTWSQTLADIAAQRAEALYEEWWKTGTISHKGAHNYYNYENIQRYGSTDANALATQWNNSPGHRTARLRASNKIYGAAIYVAPDGATYAVEIFYHIN